MLSDKAKAVLKKYNARLAKEKIRMKTTHPNELFAKRDEFLLPIGEESAYFLHTIIVGCDAKVIVELGTSYGYSTLFLANAASKTGGQVITYELSEEKQRYAQQMLAEAGLSEFVQWRCGDAVALLDDQPAEIDFVLLDLWKELYIPCFDKVYPKLAESAVIAADNMLSPPMHLEDAKKYQIYIAGKADLKTTLLPIGEGIALSCFWPGS